MVEVAILYMVLRSAFVSYMLEDIHSTLADWMLEVAEMPKQESLADVRRSIEPDAMQFNENQMRYLNDVTSDSHRAIRFHQLYCVEGDKNPYIYGQTLYKMCSALGRNKTRLQS